MNRQALEQILPKKQEHWECCDIYILKDGTCNCGAANVNQTIDACLDALEKAGVGVVPLEICICAAIKLANGLIVRGHRHGDCINNINKRPGIKEDYFKEHIQGFITSKNRFVGREEGRKLQDAAGIPSAEKEGGYRGNALFSEDLY